MPDVEIRAYLRAMHDTRLASCHGRSYPSADKGVVSILLDYNENQFYDLKLTLASIIKHTPEFLIQVNKITASVCREIYFFHRNMSKMSQ